jgi:hypothetical protein
MMYDVESLVQLISAESSLERHRGKIFRDHVMVVRGSPAFVTGNTNYLNGPETLRLPCTLGLTCAKEKYLDSIEVFADVTSLHSPLPNNPCSLLSSGHTAPFTCRAIGRIRPTRTSCNNNLR